MKRSTFFISMVLTIAGCNSFTKKDSVKDFMPGIYVRPIHHEFAIGSDTLEIALLHDNNYTIVKNSGLQRMLDGKRFPWEHKSEQWVAIYQQKEQQLMEQRYGGLLSFDVDHHRLFLGGTEYQKIK
jgi:hypothetical protein